MNASGILTRLSDVQKKISELGLVMNGASPLIVAQWSCPDLTSGQVINDTTDDPNCLCCPQLTDFDVDR